MTAMKSARSAETKKRITLERHYEASVDDEEGH
jgi:hypothetical protein